MEKRLFEVCCGSAQDALAAYKGGASRVELNSDLFHGGLTPTVGDLITVKKYAPDLKVMCMVRPREGGFCYTDLEFEVMLADAKLLLDHGADGIVFGCLHEDGTIDVDRCKSMLEIIGEKESVFHRAIDVVPNVFETLDILMDLGVTRVLTSGQKPTALEGADTICAMIEHTKGRMEILPGSGIRLNNAIECYETFGVTYLHGSAHQLTEDLSLQGNPDIHFHGSTPLPEHQYKVVFSEDVKKFIKNANNY